MLLVRTAMSSVTEQLRFTDGERLSREFSSLVRVNRMEGTVPPSHGLLGHPQWPRYLLVPVSVQVLGAAGPSELRGCSLTAGDAVLPTGSPQIGIKRNCSKLFISPLSISVYEGTKQCT